MKVDCIETKCNLSSALRCEGCQKHFCFRHWIEHRSQLSEELNTILQSYNEVKEEIDGENSNRDSYRSIIHEIQLWEKSSIEKIQQFSMKLQHEAHSDICGRKSKCFECKRPEFIREF